MNALGVLQEGGIIVVHDTRPVSFSTQTRLQGDTYKWHGDVWRAIVFLRLTHPNLFVMTVDTDEGCTLISKGPGEPYSNIFDDSLFTWEFFAENYKELLNLVDVAEFLERFGN